jgi:hypothetical protein
MIEKILLVDDKEANLRLLTQYTKGPVSVMRSDGVNII